MNRSLAPPLMPRPPQRQRSLSRSAPRPGRRREPTRRRRTTAPRSTRGSGRGSSKLSVSTGAYIKTLPTASRSFPLNVSVTQITWSSSGVLSTSLHHSQTKNFIHHSLQTVGRAQIFLVNTLNARVYFIISCIPGVVSVVGVYLDFGLDLFLPGCWEVTGLLRYPQVNYFRFQSWSLFGFILLFSRYIYGSFFANAFIEIEYLNI